MCYSLPCLARLAQLVEQPLYTGKVGSSSLSPRTLKSVSVTVRGKVQGVFYRETIAAVARELGITGTVENKADGSVRIVAEGEESELQKLLEGAHAGSSYSKVEEVSVEWLEPRGEYRGFTIT